MMASSDWNSGAQASGEHIWNMQVKHRSVPWDSNNACQEQIDLAGREGKKQNVAFLNKGFNPEEWAIPM